MKMTCCLLRSGCRTTVPHRLPADFACISGDCQASVLTDGPKPSIEAGANLSFEPSMHNSFMMTLDAKPYFNSKAVAMKIDSNMHPQNQAFNTEDNQQMIPGSDTSEEEKKVDKNSVRENIMSMMQLLKSKYNFRYNTVMKFVEYMPKEKGGMVSSPWIRECRSA